MQLNFDNVDSLFQAIGLGLKQIDDVQAKVKRYEVFDASKTHFVLRVFRPDEPRVLNWTTLRDVVLMLMTTVEGFRYPDYWTLLKNPYLRCSSLDEIAIVCDL